MAHLIEVNGLRLLLDCGMYQRARDEARRLNQYLPEHFSTIDAIILSHGHLDHCGKLPVIVLIRRRMDDDDGRNPSLFDKLQIGLERRKWRCVRPVRVKRKVPHIRRIDMTVCLDHRSGANRRLKRRCQAGRAHE